MRESNTELQCPRCNQYCSNVEVGEGGYRQGICQNPNCELNQDGIGLVTEFESGRISMSFPIRGPRLEILKNLAHKLGAKNDH